MGNNNIIPASMTVEAAKADVMKTVNVSQTTITKVAAKAYRQHVATVKSYFYTELKETEKDIRDEFRSSEFDASVAAMPTNLSAEDLADFYAKPGVFAEKKTRKTSSEEKAAVAENYSRNRAELKAALATCVTVNVELANALITAYANGEFKPENRPVMKKKIELPVMCDMTELETIKV